MRFIIQVSFFVSALSLPGKWNCDLWLFRVFLFGFCVPSSPDPTNVDQLQFTIQIKNRRNSERVERVSLLLFSHFFCLYHIVKNRIIALAYCANHKWVQIVHRNRRLRKIDLKGKKMFWLGAILLVVAT